MTFCVKCGAELKTDSKFCTKCGQEAPVQAVTEVVKQKKNPSTAVALSLLLMGAGQIYNGEVGKGVILLGLAFFGSIIMVYLFGILGWIFIGLLWIYNLADAYTTAKKINLGT